MTNLSRKHSELELKELLNGDKLKIVSLFDDFLSEK
jgi:hypothetical protein